MRPWHDVDEDVNAAFALVLHVHLLVPVLGLAYATVAINKSGWSKQINKYVLKIMINKIYLVQDWKYASNMSRNTHYSMIIVDYPWWRILQIQTNFSNWTKPSTWACYACGRGWYQSSLCRKDASRPAVVGTLNTSKIIFHRLIFLTRLGQCNWIF